MRIFVMGIIKNIYGSASLGQKIIFENGDLRFANFKKEIIQELVVGKEYNLDILSNTIAQNTKTEHTQGPTTNARGTKISTNKDSNANSKRGVSATHKEQNPTEPRTRHTCGSSSKNRCSKKKKP